MDNPIVTIISVEEQKAACLIKEKLEFEGIQCFITDEGVDTQNNNTSDANKIKVRIGDTEKAVKALLKIQDKFDLKKIDQADYDMSLKKILVPIDLSDCALSISKYAIEMAKGINAELHFLNVYENPSESGSTKRTTSWEKHAKLVASQALSEAQDKLVKFADQISEEIPEEDLAKVKLFYSLHKGEAVSVIKSVSEKYNPHLMIIAPKGQHDKSNIFMGCVTTKIVENTKFPTLTIPEAASFPGHKLNVMYATNFNGEEHKDLDKLLNILEPFETEIHCIHIDIESDPLKKGKMNELNEMFKTKYDGVNIQCDLFENKDLLQGFEAFIKEKDIDIVSFSSPKRTLIDKIFSANKLKKMISASKTPMLIFRI